MAGSDQETRGGFGRQLSADTSTPRPLRLALVEALRAVAGACEALRSIDGDVRRGNLASLVAFHATQALVCFWQYLDDAQDLLERIPADALRDLQNLAGRPWKLATRQALDEIARPIQATRPWYEATLCVIDHDDMDREIAERQAALTAWETADFSTWPALLADLDKLTANLRAVRNERYPAAGDGAGVQPSGTAAQDYWLFFRFKAGPPPADSMNPDVLGDIEILGDLTMSPKDHEELVKQLYEPSPAGDWHVFDTLNDATESELQLVLECLQQATADDSIEFRAVPDTDARKNAAEYVLLRRKWKSCSGRETESFDDSHELLVAGKANELLAEIRELNPKAGGAMRPEKTPGAPADAQPQAVPDLQAGADPRGGAPVDTLQPQAVRGAGAAGELQDAAHGGDGMTWQDVQGELETLRLKGERYTSQQRLADRIGCKKFLVQKAIANGPAELQEWASKQRGASRLNAAPEAAAVAFQNTPQARELDPANIIEDGDIDAAMAYLLDQAGPDERARINAMSPAERRKLAETVYQDPDQEEQALRHRRAAKTRRN